MSVLDYTWLGDFLMFNSQIKFLHPHFFEESKVTARGVTSLRFHKKAVHGFDCNCVLYCVLLRKKLLNLREMILIGS